MFNRKWLVAGLMTIAMIVAACSDKALTGFEVDKGTEANIKFQSATTAAEYTALKAEYGKLGQEGKVGVGFCEIMLGNPAAAATAFASIASVLTLDLEDLADIPARDRALDGYAGWAIALYSSASASDEALAIEKALVVLGKQPNYTAKIDTRIDRNDVALVAAALYLKSGNTSGCAVLLNKIDTSFKTTASYGECLTKVQTLSTVGLLQ